MRDKVLERSTTNQITNLKSPWRLGGSKKLPTACLLPLPTVPVSVPATDWRLVEDENEDEDERFTLRRRHRRTPDEPPPPLQPSLEREVEEELIPVSEEPNESKARGTRFSTEPRYHEGE